MLRFIYGSDLGSFPKLSQSMFTHRALQFKVRLGWDVKVSADGEEKDEYDALNPLYLIWERPDGSHGGSMRFLPTTGNTMVNDHFKHLLDGVEVRSPLIWECTRFCLAPDAGREVTASLILGAAEIMQNFALEHFVGVFDPKMERIYKYLGISPDVIGRKGEGQSEFGVGLWEFDETARPQMETRAGFKSSVAKEWFDLAFNRKQAPETKSLLKVA